MMKRSVAFLLTVAMVLGMMAMAASAADVGVAEELQTVVVQGTPAVLQTEQVSQTVAPAISLRYPSASFEGAVVYNVYFTVQGMESVAPEDMGLAVFDTRLPEGTVEDAVELVPGAANSGSLYMVHTNGIPAKNLGDTVYFRVYAQLEDGSYVYSSLAGTSMVSYANSVLASSEDEALRELVVATLHYGAAAQLYFGYKTDDLMDKCMPPDGHDYEDVWTVETPATLDAAGLEYRLCVDCGSGREEREIPQLTVASLTVTQGPDKTAYYTNESFESAGMAVTATLSDGSTMEVTDFTVDKGVLTAEDTFVTVSYREASTTVPVTVDPVCLVSVSQLTADVAGTDFLVEGYYVGVAEEGATSDKELLLKDLATDDIIAVRNVAYGAFPDYGYETGDRIRLLGQLQVDGTANTPDKRYLDFSADNGAIESTIVSSGDRVTYQLTDTVKVSSWAQMQELFQVGTIQAYTYVELEGPLYVNRYTGSDGVTISRIHLNEAATGVSGIRTDGSRTVTLRDNVMAANLGADWSELFFDDIPATGSYPGTVLKGSLVALYTGGNNYYYQLTVLDSSWAQLSEYDSYDAVTEVAYAFYRQGTQIQYDQTQSRRILDPSPEDATGEHTVYLDCSSYVNAVYQETFGTSVMDSTKTPTTANYTSYAMDRVGLNEDVIGYWENGDYTTDEQISTVLTEVRQQMQVGDVLVYRHGQTSGSSGHVYIYVGEDTFLHCTGSSYHYADTPDASYDKGTTAEKTGGAVQTIAADDIFVDTTNTRYLFKVTASDSVYSFALLRPMARGLTVTDETHARMDLRGVDMEKTVDVGSYQAVLPGQTVCFTVTLTNGSLTDHGDVVLEEVLPEGMSFLSGTEGITVSGQTLRWSGTVDAGTTVEVSYTVTVAADATGVLEGSAAVDGIGLNTVKNTVSCYDEAQLAAVAEAASGFAADGTTFEDPIAMAQAAYQQALGLDPLGRGTVLEALDALIDSDNDTFATGTAISGLLVPDLYGGLDIKSGMKEDPRRTRLMLQSYLAVGDIILAEFGGESVAFLYAGDGVLVRANSDGSCASVTMEGDAFSSSNILVTLLAYDRYAVVRPSMA